MKLNDDFEVPVLVHGGRLAWVDSPAAGVRRRMLYRQGEEIARATSIVRYAPGSAFPRHAHDGGEEILVLEGVFQDEHGDYPAGAYFRNPPGTAHRPASAAGCTLFVRLWQFDRDDRAGVVRQPGAGEAGPLRPGAEDSRVLFQSALETVLLERWAAGAEVRLDNLRGLELLVVSGSFAVDGAPVEAQGWLRLPPGRSLDAVVASSGAEVWLKSAPLRLPNACALPPAT